MPVLFPLPDLQGFRIEQTSVENHQVVLVLSRTRRQGRCPLCKRRSERIHSRYHRTLADLPIRGYPVRLQVRVRRFFCLRRRCPRQIFAEPLAELAAPYARRTQPLGNSQQQVGLALGGNAGARLTCWIGMPTSASTLLRLVRRMPAPESDALRVVGVDDWAFKKGHRYGTILVDLQRRSVVDLLPDRSSESLAAWLKQHPGLEVVSRDRAGVYADGARQGAPQAQQVADRWHLLHNLGEAMQRLTAQHTASLRQAAAQTLSSVSETENAVLTQGAAPRGAELRRLERGTEREALYNQIKTLRQQGWTIPDIVAQVGVSKRTVQRFLRAEQFPARARRRRQPRQTDRYEAYLRQCVEAGCHNAAKLYREVKAQGYSGAYASIYQVVQGLTASHSDSAQEPHSQKARSSSRSALEVPPSRGVAWWLQGHLSSKPEVAAEQKAYLEHLYVLAPVLKEAAALAQEFARMVKKREGDALDTWLEKAGQSTCNEVRLFAQGLRQDLAAVRHAVTLEWSNGQVEGQVNRLKMLKRQMYGRAGFGLLRTRVLLAR
jgi:transposase